MSAALTPSSQDPEAPMVILLSLLACTEKDAVVDSGTRFIPDYSDACFPSDAAEFDAAVSLLEAHVAANEFQVAEVIEVCNENSCAPCDPNTNPILNVVRDARVWGSTGLVDLIDEGEQSYSFGDTGEPQISGMEFYFAQALGYPWRQLMMSLPTGASGASELTFTQGIARDACADGSPGCQSMAIQSLDATCESFKTTLDAEVSAEALSSTSTAGEFGFQVPLSLELPDPDGFADVAALEAWIATVPALTVQMQDVSVDWTVDEDGNTCATVTGMVNGSDFSDVASSAGAVDPYLDANGQVEASLSLQLAPVTVELGNN